MYCSWNSSPYSSGSRCVSGAMWKNSGQLATVSHFSEHGHVFIQSTSGNSTKTVYLPKTANKKLRKKKRRKKTMSTEIFFMCSTKIFPKTKKSTIKKKYANWGAANIWTNKKLAQNWNRLEDGFWVSNSGWCGLPAASNARIIYEEAEGPFTSLHFISFHFISVLLCSVLFVSFRFHFASPHSLPFAFDATNNFNWFSFWGDPQPQMVMTLFLYIVNSLGSKAIRP